MKHGVGYVLVKVRRRRTLMFNARQRTSVFALPSCCLCASGPSCGAIRQAVRGGASRKAQRKAGKAATDGEPRRLLGMRAFGQIRPT